MASVIGETVNSSVKKNITNFPDRNYWQSVAAARQVVYSWVVAVIMYYKWYLVYADR